MAPTKWLRRLLVGSLPSLLLAALCAVDVSAQGVAETVLLRWLDPSPEPGATGFIVHLEANGIVTHLAYTVGDGALSENGRVYSVFLDIGPHETHVAVSAVAVEGVFANTWSDGSEVRTYHSTTLCDRSDFTSDGIVGGPDFGVFASQFGMTCLTP